MNETSEFAEHPGYFLTGTIEKSFLETSVGQVSLTLDSPETSLDFWEDNHNISQWQISGTTKDVARDVSGTIVIEITR